MEAFLRNQIRNVCRIRNPPVHHIRKEDDDIRLPRRYERIHIDGNVLSYMPDGRHRVGLYIASVPMNPDECYFELEIVDAGIGNCIAIGLVPYQYPLNAQPGWKSYSVGYHADDGRLYKSSGHGQPFGPRCRAGDRMGCGVRFPVGIKQQANQALVFFTRNGKELGSMRVPVPPGGLHPAVGMHSDGEEAKLFLDAEWTGDESMQMAVDYCEDDWKRLHDVRLAGQVLEYIGRGKTIHDVGLAQAKLPLSTTNHYFELEILDPGESCYIAIGLAKKNYPKHRHPGWNRGSIAYHADDGKIFIGTGVGDPFGPRCFKGDVMGCGIQFPSDYDFEAEDWNAEEEDDYDPISDDSPDEEDEFGDRVMENYDDAEDEEEPEGEDSVMVEVFFNRNGRLIGKRKVPLPKGGFYPTIGMLSSCEKVRVDLRPLTG